MPYLDHKSDASQSTEGAGAPTGTDPAARRAAWLRLGALIITLAGVAAVFIAGGVIGTDRVRGWVDPLGAFGPLLYIPLSAVLGTLFVPGAVLAAAAGLLFGPWVGAVSALAAGTCAALLSRSVSGRAGKSSFEQVAEGKVRALADLARHNGFVAVIVARLAPWVPDAPVNHAFGVVGLGAVTLALGHLVAAGPRALAYATIGANTDDPTGNASLAGWALNITTGLIGTAVLAYVVVRHRRARQARETSLTGQLSGQAASEATQE